MKLCFSTVANILLYYYPHYEQRGFIGCVLSCFEENPDTAQLLYTNDRITKCISRKAPVFSQLRNFTLDEDEADEISSNGCKIVRKETIINNIETRLIPLLDNPAQPIHALKLLILRDDSIESDTTIDLFSGTKKCDLLYPVRDYASFIGGLLAYVIRYRYSEYDAKGKPDRSPRVPIDHEFFQDAAAFKDINPPTEIFTKASISTFSEIDVDTELRFRNKEYEEITQICAFSKTEKTLLAITSDGGIGKTTMARILYHKLRAKYTAIGWVDYSVNLDSSILAAFNKWESDNPLDRLDKIDSFFREPGKKLLIIDNVLVNQRLNQIPQKETGHFSFFSIMDFPNLDVVLTTRFPSFLLFRKYKLKALDVETGSRLFAYYYDSDTDLREYTQAEQEYIRKIVTDSKQNTLLIELYAKAARGRAIECFYFDFEAHHNQITNIDIPTSHAQKHLRSNDRKDIITQIQQLYDMNSFGSKDQIILWEFAVLPHVKLNERDILLLLNTDVNSIIRLKDLGWISFDRGEYYMHDIIKESILSRRKPNPRLSLEETGIEDYSDYSICYNSNKAGFAPEECFSAICQSYRALFGLFEIYSTYQDTDKLCKVLISIVDHLKLSNIQLGCILSILGQKVFHVLNDKMRAETYLKKALESMKEACPIQRRCSDESFLSTSQIHAQKLEYNITDYYYTKTAYELAYVLSSMGYERFHDAYQLIDGTLKYHCVETTSSPTLMLPQGFTLPILTPIINTWSQLCTDNNIANSNLQVLTDYTMLARILDHAGYIITISKEADYSCALKYLNVSLQIRETVFQLLSPNGTREEYYRSFVNPFEEFFHRWFDMLCKESEEKHMEWIFSVTSATQENPLIIQNCKAYHEELENAIKARSFKRFIQLYYRILCDSDYKSSLQDLATTEDNLGYLLLHMNELSESKKHLVRADKLRTELECVDPKNHLSELSWTKNNLGELYMSIGSDEGRNIALAYYNEAIEIRKELNKLHNGRYRANLAWSYVGLWRCYMKCSDTAMAEECKNAAMRIYDSINQDGLYNNNIQSLSSGSLVDDNSLWLGNQSHFIVNKKREEKPKDYK